MYEAGHSKLVLWETPEGWGGVGRWRGGSGWGYTCTDSCLCKAKPPQYCNEPPIKINKLI